MLNFEYYITFTIIFLTESEKNIFFLTNNTFFSVLRSLKKNTKKIITDTLQYIIFNIQPSDFDTLANCRMSYLARALK